MYGLSPAYMAQLTREGKGPTAERLLVPSPYVKEPASEPTPKRRRGRPTGWRFSEEQKAKLSAIHTARWAKIKAEKAKS